MTRLQYLNGLKAFEASARHLSFTVAAAELSVTPAAVSQQVRALESALGIVLFQRSSSGSTRLVLTDLAEQALPDIRAGFGHLAKAMEYWTPVVYSDALTVTVSPAFATKWLLPRIDLFQKQWPTITVHLQTTHQSLDFYEHPVDIGVRYGQGAWAGLYAEKLLDEEVYPVCTPEFRHQLPEKIQPKDLLNTVLIHDASMSAFVGFPSWATWFNVAGLEVQVPSQGLHINNSAAVLQTALESHGIALARSVMAHDDILVGRLVRLFPAIRCPSSMAYYVVYRPETDLPAHVQAFRCWLLAQAAQYQRV